MLALVLAVPATEAELAADALWALGVPAIEERVPSDVDDAYVELWTSLGDDAGVVERAAEASPERWRWHTVEVDESVAESWREHARPTWIDDGLVIAPAWIDVAAPDHVTVVRIEPGATFGLGDHPTTVLCLRALRASALRDATVLDVGCGSGVLAITACVLGAARADAIDISPAAVAATAANARANGVGGRVDARHRPLAEVADAYDVVVANILAPTLVELADDLVRVLASAGVLIVSGVLTERSEHVVAALAPLTVVDVQTSGGWAAVTLRR
jgi:ribosomal protein L11 methyltransferase